MDSRDNDNYYTQMEGQMFQENLMLVAVQVPLRKDNSAECWNENMSKRAYA